MKKMNRFFSRNFLSSVVAVIALFIIIVFINFLSGKFYSRADITEDNLYTLSDGTLNMIKNLPEDVALKFFYSADLPNLPPALKNYAARVKDLLDEYVNNSDGNIQLEEFNPKPDSDAEEWAQKYGVAGSPLNPLDYENKFFFGVVAEAVDKHAAIPFLDPQREKFLEYDLSYLIFQVTHPEKKTVGIISSLPVTGTEAQPFVMGAQSRPKPSPPWVFVQELKKTFDVVEIETNAVALPKKLNLLLVIHPKDLAEETKFAIDQFVLNGGKAVFFVDPFCNVDTSSGPMGMSFPGSSELNDLFNAWGFDVPDKKIVVDMEHPTTVSIGRGRAEKSPAWITADVSMFNPDDIMCAELDRLLFPVAGFIKKLEKSNCEITPLVRTSKKAMKTDAFAAMRGNEEIVNNFVSENKQFTLAAKISGAFNSAFTNGAPKNVATTNLLKTAVGSNTVVVIADVDLLADQFNFQELNIFGFTAHRPFNNNIDFVLNGADQLCGDDNLISIRSRAKFDRPFTVVDELERRAQQKWLDHEKELSAELQRVQQALNEMQMKKDKSQRFIISEEQQKKIQEFKQKQIEIAKQLKNVRKNLRKDIEDLGFRLKFYNMALVPILVCFFGIGLALYRRYKIKNY